MSIQHRTGIYTILLSLSLTHFSNSLYKWLQLQACICTWERVLFPLQSPLLVSPHILPAISGANLKLCYYESCTWCVGGRFRTSTPSINPPMGPTSWLNRLVPLPDNLSSDEAKLRSCNYTQPFFSPSLALLKSSFDDFLTCPFNYLLEASSRLTAASLPKDSKWFSFCFYI